MNNELISKNKYIIIVVILFFGIVGGILGYLQNKNKANSIPSVSPTASISPSFSPVSVVTPPPEVWETYTNSQLGFSIKYPQMVYGVYDCFKKETVFVPLKFFEDNENGITYITEEYYYNNGNSSNKTQDSTSICKKIDYSLESLKNEDKNVIFPDGTYYSGWKPSLGWKILTSNIKNNIELNKFIKDNYGSGCLMESKKAWNLQEDVYEIKLNAFKDVNGKDTDLGSTVCPVNYAYKIFYEPLKNKLMSIILGQECTFGTDYNLQSYKCYDEEMINSFRF